MGDIRIIAGIHGSRRIKAPASAARPTTDRVRESLFSSLGSLRGGFEGARVLDAFAGSGALGLEALSRGAACACFVESDAKALRTVRANMQLLGYDQPVARAAQADSLDAAQLAVKTAACGPFDLVLLDAPYAYAAEDVLRSIAALCERGIVAEDAIIAYEHAAGALVEPAVEALPFELVKEKAFGTCVIALLRPELRGC